MARRVGAELADDTEEAFGGNRWQMSLLYITSQARGYVYPLRSDSDMEIQ
jgi:hypothetical protein